MDAAGESGAETLDGNTVLQLCSSDGRGFQVAYSIARLSQTIKNIVDDLDETQEIPLPNVTGDILEKVIEYCTEHKDDRTVAEEEELDEMRRREITGWDATFVDVDLATLFQMILAANFLDVKPMLDLTCKAVAHSIRGKTSEEIKRFFGVQSDFTPQEEEVVLKENEWLREKPLPWFREDDADEPAAGGAPVDSGA